MRVAGKAAGKVVTIVGVLFARHSDLVSGVDLRHAAQREDKSLRQLERGDRTIRFREKTRGVVVANERNQLLRMRVERVLAKNLS